MDFFTPYAFTGIPADPADRDPHGVYFIRTATGYKQYMIANTVGREIIELDLPGNTTPTLQQVTDAGFTTTNPIAQNSSYTDGKAYPALSNGINVETNIKGSHDDGFIIKILGGGGWYAANYTDAIVLVTTSGSTVITQPYSRVAGMLGSITAITAYFNSAGNLGIHIAAQGDNAFRFELINTMDGSSCSYNVSPNTVIPSTATSITNLTITPLIIEGADVNNLSFSAGILVSQFGLSSAQLATLPADGRIFWGYANSSYFNSNWGTSFGTTYGSFIQVPVREASPATSRLIFNNPTTTTQALYLQSTNSGGTA